MAQGDNSLAAVSVLPRDIPPSIFSSPIPERLWCHTIVYIV